MDEAVLKIVVKEDESGGSRPAPLPALAAAPPSAPPNSQAQFSSPTPAAAVPSPAVPAAIFGELRDVLESLGHSKKEAEAMVAQLRASGQTFAGLQEGILAAYRKPGDAAPTSSRPPVASSAQPPSAPATPTATPAPPSPAPAGRTAAPAQTPSVPASSIAAGTPPAQPQSNRSGLSLESTQQQVLSTLQNRGAQPPQARPASQPQQRTSPVSPQSNLDIILDFAAKLRGTLGGVFGTLVGSVLDALSAYRQQQQHASGSQQAVPPSQQQANIPPGFGTQSGQATIPQIAASPAAAPPLTANRPAGPPTPLMGNIPVAGNTVGGGGLAAVAAQALPIVGMVVAGVEAYKKIVDSLDEATTGAVRAVGGFAAAVANPDANPATAVSGLGDAAKAAGDKMLYAVPAIGIFLNALGEAGTQLGKLMRVLDGMSDRYGEYSPQIALAQAMGEIRQTLGDFRRAQEVGPEIARYLQARSDVQQRIEDIKVKFLVKILPIVTSMLSFLEKIMPAADAIEGGLDAIAAPLSLIAEGIAQILQLQREQEQQPLVEDPTETILRSNVQIPGI